MKKLTFFVLLSLVQLNINAQQIKFIENKTLTIGYVGSVPSALYGISIFWHFKTGDINSGLYFDIKTGFGNTNISSVKEIPDAEIFSIKKLNKSHIKFDFGFGQIISKHFIIYTGIGHYIDNKEQKHKNNLTIGTFYLIPKYNISIQAGLDILSPVGLNFGLGYTL